MNNPQKEIIDWEKSTVYWQNESKAKDAKISELEKRVGELGKYLWKYGRHQPRCYPTVEDCYCGWSKILMSIAKKALAEGIAKEIRVLKTNDS